MTSALLFGCDDGEKLQETQGQVEVNADEVESLRAQNKYLTQKNQQLVASIQQAIAHLSDEEMLEFAQSQFVYELQVNRVPVPKNGQMSVAAGDVEVLLAQYSLGHDFLPAKWVEKGKISEDYMDHLGNFDTTNWTLTGTDGTVNTAQGYQTNLKAGQSVFFRITDELKKRLQLDTKEIQIQIN